MKRGLAFENSRNPVFIALMIIGDYKTLIVCLSGWGTGDIFEHFPFYMASSEEEWPNRWHISVMTDTVEQGKLS